MDILHGLMDEWISYSRPTDLDMLGILMVLTISMPNDMLVSVIVCLIGLMRI